jgi:putative ABC transport system ATP-binding protein
MDLLEKINQLGTTVVVVTHDAEMAARADRQIYLLDGRLVDVESRDRPKPLYRPEAAESGSQPEA